MANTTFDKLLVSSADILLRTPGAADEYGVAPSTFATVDSGISCRLSTVAKGRPKEYKSEKKFEVKYVTVFMRPWVDPADGTPLTHDHWFLINGQYYDIFQINDPSGIGHHLEVDCELVVP